VGPTIGLNVEEDIKIYGFCQDSNPKIVQPVAWSQYYAVRVTSCSSAYVYPFVWGDGTGSYGTGTKASQNCHMLLKYVPFLTYTVPPQHSHHIPLHFSRLCRITRENLAADGRTILKLIINWLGMIWFRIGTRLACFCEGSDETSGNTKCVEHLD
jgi:hypothetical protein